MRVSSHKWFIVPAELNPTYLRSSFNTSYLLILNDVVKSQMMVINTSSSHDHSSPAVPEFNSLHCCRMIVQLNLIFSQFIRIVYIHFIIISSWNQVALIITPSQTTYFSRMLFSSIYQLFLSQVKMEYLRWFAARTHILTISET